MRRVVTVVERVVVPRRAVATTRTETVVITVPGAATTLTGEGVTKVVKSVFAPRRNVTAERVVTVVTTVPGAARTVTDERVTTEVRTVTTQLAAASVTETQSRPV